MACCLPIVAGAFGRSHNCCNSANPGDHLFVNTASFQEPSELGTDVFQSHLETLLGSAGYEAHMKQHADTGETTAPRSVSGVRLRLVYVSILHRIWPELRRRRFWA